MSASLSIILFNVLFYPLCFLLPFISGRIIYKTKGPLEKKLKLIRMLTMVYFIVAILSWFSVRESLSLSHLLLDRAESWGSVLLYFLVFILEIVSINTLTLTLPRFYLNRSLRHTTQKALPVLSSRIFMMVLQLMTWIFLWVAYMLLQAIFTEAWIIYPLLAVWILLVLILVQRLMRALMIPRRDRDLDKEKEHLALIQTMAEKAGVKLHRMVYLKTRDSKTANAWAWGGLRPMITLYDYLFENLDDKQREIVVFHELGHIRLKHTLVRLIITVLTLSLSLYLINLLITTYTSLESIWYFIISQTIILLCTYFLPSFLYRHQEHQADLFAIKHSSEPRAFADTMLELSRLNHSGISTKKGPNLISTHPHILRRIEWLEKKTGLNLLPEQTENRLHSQDDE